MLIDLCACMFGHLCHNSALSFGYENMLCPALAIAGGLFGA